MTVGAAGRSDNGGATTRVRTTTGWSARSSAPSAYTGVNPCAQYRVILFRLARLHGRHGNRSARIDRHELQPSLPHAILGEATHDASVEGGGRVGDRRIKFSKNFSHGSIE